MKLRSITFFLIIMFLSHSAMAMVQQIITPWLVSENFAFPEKIVQIVMAQLSGDDEEQKNKDDKEKIEKRDPNADDDSAKVKENKGNPESSEFPPYADKELRTALAQKEPSIPEVESIIKGTFVYQSETLNEKGDVEVDKKTSDTVAENENGSLERLQMQTILTYENARALARRAIDLSGKAQQDAQEIEEENNSRTTTGSMQKGMASSVIFRTHQLLNEIAVLRNSYIEINAINAIQGTEAPKKSEGIIEGVMKKATGG